MLAALAQRRPIEEPVAIVVAHPDDETIAAGGSLHLMRHLLLVHVTDGAPRRLGDAAREGFATPAEYAASRAQELDAALALSGASPIRKGLDVADQEATDCISEIAARLRTLFRAHDVRHVMTHAYEGGHPDHDAIALAVRLVADDIYEFAGYHAASGGGILTGKFLEGTGEIAVELPDADLARKRAMLDCFRTQKELLANFDPATERFRPAPTYDFTAPPHPGQLLYEEWGWMTGADWRRRAREARCAA